ncbi:hypothetical protein ABE29_20485 [Cytobacillus firmus]|uniref:hypothetical protein n=1 Tax=Cytobacillus TaxID=2675230 RepID=UPI00077C17EC|nr:hypothetical protein [Cytobacillus firmus]MBG9545055.1 hypothetical protein [Cytobacillus firmus]MBG9551319.1 hypothetical protein [Cytobacillus firmus]MBG9558963.1 hypothetical protein [Cytobacillus firmus]MBG9573323.1 hypothetical protein [Cytobacillus firmus]MEC1895588.1 hypothetical protein [Cytobacillus firmus]
MKKILLILAIAFFTVGSGASAEVAGEGEVIEIKDKTTKTFMYQILSMPYIHHVASDFYHKKYNAESIGWGLNQKIFVSGYKKLSPIQVRLAIPTL